MNDEDSMITMRPGAESALGRIDQYDLVRKLGGGGFGVVWLARDTASGMDVALKTLHPLLKNSPEEMEALREKFKLAARLSHPNIASALVLHPVREVSIPDETARRELKLSPGDSVMVMRYAPGVTLSKWRKQFPDGVVPPDQALEVGRQIAAALDYAHSEKIVHRDVKPGNVMVETLDDGKLRVRLLDFGLAAEIRSSMSRVSNETGDVSGTRPYMAPEQWLGETQDGRTDQYALACVLYELVSGAPPFAGVFETGDPVIMLSVVEKRAPKPVEGLPETANAALLRALAKDPKDRFPSCAAFVEALTRGAGGEKDRAEFAETAALDAGRARSPSAPPPPPSRMPPSPSPHGPLGPEYFEPKTGESASGFGRFFLFAALVAAVGVMAYHAGQSEPPPSEPLPPFPATTTTMRYVAPPPRPTTTTTTRPSPGMSVVARSPRVVELPGGGTMRFRGCPAGSFTMGSPEGEDGSGKDETPHEVTLSRGFWMGETEVTQGQWKALMDGETILDLARKAFQDDTKYVFSNGTMTYREWAGVSRDDDPASRCGALDDETPVYFVSWDDAVRFCRRLTEQERRAGRLPAGYEYRLPTEAEWEYACRAGTTTALPNGRDIQILGEHNAPALDEIAWYGGNSSVGFTGRGWDTDGWKEKQYPGGWAAPRRVATKAANEWGLHDMIGNMWEWCADWYGAYPTVAASVPTGPGTGVDRVLRGGSWNDRARYCRSAIRGRGGPGYRNNDLGFRVALAPVLER